MPRGRKKSDVSREEKLLKKREAERQRRALRKNDPELREEDRIKEHLRYIQRKNDGRIKLLKDLNERDRRAKRKKLKENLAAFRLRQKVLDQALRNTPPPSPPQPTPARPNSSDGGSSRREAGRRRIKRNRSKIYREYERLKKHNKSLQQAKERYRKQLDRLRTKLEKQKFFSPNTKVNQLLKKDTPENRREVRRKLVFAETTEQQLTYSYKNLKKQKHKQAFVKLIGGDILKKYRALMKAGSYFSYKIYRSNRRRNLSTLRYEKALKRSAISLEAKVKSFFLDDENSTICPGKKDHVRVNKLKVRKRYLNDTLKVLYRKFIETTTVKVSFSTFCRFRPRNVVAPKLSARDTCLCVKHMNFKLLVTKLHKGKVIGTNNPTILVQQMCCEERKQACYMRKCEICAKKNIPFLDVDSSQDFVFMKWVNITEGREIKGKEVSVKRLVKQEIRMTIEEGKHELENDLVDFMQHVYKIIHQQRCFRQMKNRSNNEMVVFIDFSENYCCKYYEEPQSVHFGASRQQLSLHTGVSYFNGSAVSFCTISSNLRHDAKAIAAHLKPTLSYLLNCFPAADTLHFISDGPTAQYRNRTMFTIMGKFLPQFFPAIKKISWNFSEAGHGKSPADGIGGSVKTTADRIVSLNNDVANLDDFIRHVSNEDSSVKIMVVTDDDIKIMDDLIKPSSLIPAVKKTMQIHQVTWCCTTNALHFNSLSCITCDIGFYCTHYTVAAPMFLDEGTTTPGIEPALIPPTDLPTSTQERSSNLASFRLPVEEGSWVAVIYDGEWFPGIVEKAEDGSQTVEINFMARSGKNMFMWPEKTDRQTVTRDGILYKLKSPPVPVSRRHMSIEEFKYIDFLCQNVQ